MTKKDLIPLEDRNITKDQTYRLLLDELRSIISTGQSKVYRAADTLKVQVYWQIGERLVREELNHQDRAGYGKVLIENVAADLGFSRRLLYEIVKFYRVYPIVHAVCAQLSWSHFGVLIEIETERARLFYQNKAVLNSWSVRELQSRVKDRLYENSSRDEIDQVFTAKLPATTDPLKIFKDQYDFRPMGLRLTTEKDLEDRIVSNIELFLKEMGDDFCFLGRQVPIRLDNETHYIDLVLYNKGIPCTVLVDLKSGKFDSRDVGQMNKYVNYYRENRQYAHEKDTIGLIICREVGRDEVHYALGGLEEKIFVAEYRIKLPSEEKIIKALQDM